MSYELKSSDTLAGGICSYEGSRLRVRGPLRDLGKPYLSFLGGTEVFGRFVERPFVQATEAQIGLPCINLGASNAGIDAFARDDALLEIAEGADLTVLQVMGAQNLTNAFYKVHPRRNDRFLRPYDALVHLYPEVDFTEFHFNKHLLVTLRDIAADRYERVCADLQETWVTRMSRVISRLGGRVVLLWLRYGPQPGDALGAAPTLVSEQMVEVLRPRVAGVVEVHVRTAAEAQDMPGMIFGPLELPTAQLMIGPREHERIADELAARLQDIDLISGRAPGLSRRRVSPLERSRGS